MVVWLLVLTGVGALLVLLGVGTFLAVRHVSAVDQDDIQLTVVPVRWRVLIALDVDLGIVATFPTSHAVGACDSTMLETTFVDRRESGSSGVQRHAKRYQLSDEDDRPKGPPERVDTPADLDARPYQQGDGGDA